MANSNRYRGKDYSSYGNREEDRDRNSRKDYNQYDSDYGNTNENDNNRRQRRYDEDWNDYNNRTSNYGNRSQGQWQGQYGNNYGSSSQYNRENDYNQYGNSGTGYGNSGAGSYGYGTEYNRNRGYDEDFNEDYGTNSYGYGRRYDRDRDYNNYNNNNRNRDWWDKTKDEVSSWFGDDQAERRRRMDKKLGAHKGRGPKGYTRSDERIREDVNDRLSDDSFLDASEIEVSVTDGEVTLTGTVDNRIDKRRAEDLAEDISGVKNVQNQLRVRQTINSLKNEYQG